ncbi:MAG: helix-turn-helix domain-containing protein [Deltaproteobacteria bacterium]
MSSHVRGCAEPADLDVKIADVAAAILELEERGAELSGAAPPNAAPAPAAAPPAPAALPEYLDTKQAAAMLGVSVKTLEACRARGKPPPFTKIGRRVRYPLEGIRDLTRKK